MSIMTAGTGPGIWRRGLPAGQQFMPVIVPAFFSTTPLASDSWHRDLFLGSKPTLGHRLVAFQTILVADGHGKHGGLDRLACIPQKCVASAHQFSLHPLRHALSGMAIDAAGLLGSMVRGQVDRLGIGRSLEKG